MSIIKVLTIGDVVGHEAINYLQNHLYSFQSKNNINLTIANGENALGMGIDPLSATNIFSAGVDIITSGNHIWKRKEIKQYLDDDYRIIRPCNYRNAPGYGYTVAKIDGYSVLVINVMGVSFMEPLDNPFISVDKILESNKGKYDFSVLDIHAEATGEKYALGKYFDGKINIIFGTHTHVQTADEQIFAKGTGFICDLGMCGPMDSVLGVKTECIIEKLMTNIPNRFDLASGNIVAHGAVFTYDIDAQKVISVERVKF